MTPKRSLKIIVSLLILILPAAGFLPAGCGKKAPPQPPARESAPPASDNSNKTVNGNVFLPTWKGIAGKSEDMAGLYAFWSKARPADSGGRIKPVLFDGRP